MRDNRRVVGLPAFAALLLASFSVAFSVATSTAVAALTAGLPAGGPVLAAAAPGPVATPVRADVRLLAQAAAHGSTDLDALSGYLRVAPAVEPAGVSGVTVAVSVPHEPGAGRHHPGRAPPRTR